MKYSPEDMFIDFRYRGRERERNINQLPPLNVPRKEIKPLT